MGAPNTTPGPWVAKWQRYDKEIAIQPVLSSGPIAWVDYDDVDQLGAEATAHQISASPDMYDALDGLLDVIPPFNSDHWPELRDARIAARAALRKARGEQS